MWPESSSVNAVNLVKKIITVTEIMNFFIRDCFLLAHPVYLPPRSFKIRQYLAKLWTRRGLLFDGTP